jgi:hypothetical protein
METRVPFRCALNGDWKEVLILGICKNLQDHGSWLLANTMMIVSKYKSSRASLITTGCSIQTQECYFFVSSLFLPLSNVCSCYKRACVLLSGEWYVFHSVESMCTWVVLVLFLSMGQSVKKNVMYSLISCYIYIMHYLCYKSIYFWRSVRVKSSDVSGGL